jgi:lysyl-tRNA synthetase class 2
VSALGCLVVAAVNLLSAVTPAESQRLETLSRILPGALTASAAAATAVSGVLLAVLSGGLRRGKRRAWRAAVVVLAGSVVLHVVKGLDIEEATVAAIVLALLIAGRGEFRAKGDQRSRWLAFWLFVALAAMSLVAGLLLVHQYEAHRQSVATELRHVVYGLAAVSGPVTFATDRASDTVAFVLAALGAITVGLPLFIAIAPAPPGVRRSASDDERLRALLAAHGSADSLGYFALRADKTLVWAPSGKAAVAFRVIRGIALATGDPLGDQEAWPHAVRAFLDACADNGWVPAVSACSERGGTAWARAGLMALEIGDEAVVELAEWTLEGRPMRGVRQAVNRVERMGYDVQVRRNRELSAAERQQLMGLALQWREGRTERGFSMALGSPFHERDPECIVVTAAEGGRIRGILYFVPWGRDGISLDLMRRDPLAENGVVELLIVKTFEAGASLGICRVSLNFAMFRSALERGARLGAGPVIRAWRGTLLFASRWLQIETLYRFNAKFRPVWQPRFLCYQTIQDLPRVVLAALEAEGFVSPPRLPLLAKLTGHAPVATDVAAADLSEDPATNATR